MAREQFIDSLRMASRLLAPPSVSTGQHDSDAYLDAVLNTTDPWLTPRSVEGFDPADFASWPQGERNELARAVAAFLEIADKVPPNKPATKAQTKQSRKHLERAIFILRQQLLREWRAAQDSMLQEATAAARKRGWHVQQDEKDLQESLLGAYKAPRLRIRANDKEVVLDPIARFGSGRQGLVDLVVMPTYETAYFVTFKNGAWQIISPRGTLHRRPFSAATFANTIAHLSHR